MTKIEQKANETYPDGDVFVFGDAGIQSRLAYAKGYCQAIKDAKEWIEKNASKDIYKNYDSTGFRSFWANGLSRDLENELTKS